MSVEDGLRNTIKKLKKQIAELQRENVGLKQTPKTALEEYTPLVMFTAEWRPLCEKHGSMLSVAKGGTLYRCGECGIGVDVSNIISFKMIRNT